MDDQQPDERIGGNVTINPLSMASPVDDPAIAHILDCATGTFHDVKDWIAGWRYEQLIPHRLEVRESLDSRPRFRCPHCAVPVYLVSNQHKRFFFKHQAEDGSCPAQTRSPLSREEMLARQYHGLKESEPHRRIKALIARSIDADPRFSDTVAEGQWRSARDPSRWRRPDVQTRGPTGRLAFEVQLSTTFLDIVVGRRSFYREEGALLVWVMGSFDPAYRRLTTDDMFFSNNSNILVVDGETATLSERTGQFHVRCHFRRPVRDGARLSDSWESLITPFDALTCEAGPQRCWLFDYEGEAAVLRNAIDRELREALFTFWIAREPLAQPGAEAHRVWDELRRSFGERGIQLPPSPGCDSSIEALLNALVSAREGRPIGWRFKRLVEVGHRIAEGYPHHAAAFAVAIRYFNRTGLLNDEDSTARWRRRRQRMRASLEAGEATFRPERESLALIDILVPGGQAKLEKLLPPTME